jgi:hypothetical protein
MEKMSLKVKLGEGNAKCAEAEIIVKDWRKRQSHTTIGSGKILSTVSAGAQNAICSIFDEKGKNVGSVQMRVSLVELSEMEALASHEVTITALGFSHLYRLDVANEKNFRDYLARSMHSNIVERLPPSLCTTHDVEHALSTLESSISPHSNGVVDGLDSTTQENSDQNWDNPIFIEHSMILNNKGDGSKGGRKSVFFREWDNHRIDA